MGTVNDEADQNYRVVAGYLPENWSGRAIKAPSPRNGRALMYLISEDGLAEIQCHDRWYGSWFAGNLVLGDSCLYLATPVDLAFFLLPLLDQAQAALGDLFQAWAQMMENSWVHGSGISTKLEQCLPMLCDCKKVGDDTYYRLSESRVLAWLRCKHQKTMQGLLELGDTYAALSEKDLKSYAAGILSEYTSVQWHSKLRAAIGLPESDGQPVVQPLTEHNYNTSQNSGKRASKIQKLDPKALAREKAREAAAEKRAQQQKRQSAGMKKMNSFFSKAKS